MANYLINYEEFKEVLDENWKKAYENFKNAKMKDGKIISMYDDEGFCEFSYKGDNGKCRMFEFIGTAK